MVSQGISSNGVATAKSLGRGTTGATSLCTSNGPDVLGSARRTSSVLLLMCQKQMQAGGSTLLAQCRPYEIIYLSGSGETYTRHMILMSKLPT